MRKPQRSVSSVNISFNNFGIHDIAVGGLALGPRLCRGRGGGGRCSGFCLVALLYLLTPSRILGGVALGFLHHPIDFSLAQA